MSCFLRSLSVFCHLLRIAVNLIVIQIVNLIVIQIVNLIVIQIVNLIVIQIVNLIVIQKLAYVETSFITSSNFGLKLFPQALLVPTLNGNFGSVDFYDGKEI